MFAIDIIRNGCIRLTEIGLEECSYMFFDSLEDCMNYVKKILRN